jgi:hypothetical protein
LLKGDGALIFGAITAMVFADRREELDVLGLQFLFYPGWYADVSGGEPGMLHTVCPVRPHSAGPLRPSAIRPNYLSTESDVQVMLSGL